MTTTRIPPSLFSALWNGSLSTSGTYRTILLGEGYSWSAAHSSRANLSDEIAAGNGYTTGGVGATITQSVDTGTGEHVLSIAPANISPGAITGVRYLAIVRWRGGGASADELVAVHDLDYEITTSEVFNHPAIVIRLKP
jgi:hypothetical protein